LFFFLGQSVIFYFECAETFVEIYARPLVKNKSHLFIYLSVFAVVRYFYSRYLRPQIDFSSTAVYKKAADSKLIFKNSPRAEKKRFFLNPGHARGTRFKSLEK